MAESNKDKSVKKESKKAAKVANPKPQKAHRLNTPKTNVGCSHGQVENIGVIVPNKYLKPINGKFIWHVDENYLSQDMEKYKIVFAFSQAFAKWQPYLSPIVFESTGDISKAQIVIRFMTNGMQGLPIPFDTGVLGYTYAPDGESLGMNADMYLNDAYKWNDILTSDSIVLFNVVVHELGHSMNLGHSTDRTDIMYPYYQPSLEVTVTKDTQRGIYNLYKSFGVANPDGTPSGGNNDSNTLSLKDLFSSKADLARLSQRQLIVLANFLNVQINNNDKFQAIVNKVYSRIYA